MRNIYNDCVRYKAYTLSPLLGGGGGVRDSKLFIHSVCVCVCVCTVYTILV